MDLWVVAAAAGAGYLANFWQSALKKDGGGGVSKQVGLDSADEKSELVRSVDQRIGQKRGETGSQLFRRLVRKQAAEALFSDTDERHSDALCTDDLLEQGDPGKMTCGGKPMSSEEYVRDDGSLLSLQPWIFKKDSYWEDGERMTEMRNRPDKYDHDMGQCASPLQSHLSSRNAGPVYGFKRNKSSLRSRKIHKYSVKPLDSTENCLIPQLYKDNIDFEEYVFGPFQSPSSQPIRSFLVTNGKQIISKSSLKPSNEEFDRVLHQRIDSTVNEVIVGIPPLQASRKPKRKCEEAERRRLDTSGSQHSSKISQFPELVERVLFFCLGLSIGVMSSVVSDKREVEKLNDMLRHSKNLVQDLQEELEMKNSLVVKELVNDDCKDEEIAQVYSPPKCDSKFSSPKQQQDKSNSQSFSRSDGKKESLSTIEAELEAELERLELNMNASCLEGRISALAELDPDLIGNAIHGELREDILNEKSRGQGDSSGDMDGSSSTPCMANYSVSPRELSLRLHEIIQSQLEERIRELETALYNSKQQLQFMEAEKANSQAGFSSSDLGTSSIQESPILMDQGQEIDHPLCLNLSGDALDAYNEAYEEFIRITKTEEENPSSTTNMSGQIDEDELCLSDQSLSYGHEAGMANETSNSRIFAREPTWEHITGNQLSEEVYGAKETEDDEIDDDEEGRMLIQQIIERTRQDSPLVINVQKILSSWTSN